MTRGRRRSIPRRSAFGADGLVPAVVQDVADGRVLMVAWMDAEALAATLATGDVHFHSRSRDRLWRKGETSGNVLRLRRLALDCDGDALLVDGRSGRPDLPPRHAELLRPRRRPRRPSRRQRPPGLRLARDAVGDDRRRGPPSDRPARTPTTLLDGGVDAAGRKVTEEATEVLIAAKDDAAAEAAGTDRTRPATPSPARPPTSSTTRSCCSPSAASARRRHDVRGRHAHGRA